MENKIRITPIKNGPLLVEGELEIKREGESVAKGNKFFLCRCGQSMKKPYCDGAHKKANFEAE